MSKFLISLTVSFLILIAAASVYAGPGTSAEAKAMAEKAAAYLQAQGAEKAVEQFQRSQGPFRKKELYVFVMNLNGDMIAHGASPKMVGKLSIDWTDPEGKAFPKEIVDGAKTKGSGWIDYKWTNPTTKKVTTKSTYYVKAGDFIVCCGAYKN